MSESASRESAINNSSAVECPSCSTRFAIDTRQVSMIEEPIFHCSRCGHYFGLKDKKLAKQVEDVVAIDVEEKTPTQLDLMPESINPEPDFTIDIETSSKVTNINSSKPNWYMRNDIEKLLEEEDEETNEVKIKAEWPSANNKQKYYIEPEEPYRLDLSEYSTDELTHHDDEYEYEDIDEMFLPKNADLTKQNVLSKLVTISDNQYDNVRNAVAILTVPVAFAFLLTIWGFNIDKTPALINSLFNFDSKLLATVAPPGLALSSLSPEIVSLDSGERAFRIKGDVINSTGTTFSNLTLEAKLFTKDNRELLRIIAPLDNSLRDTENITALNSESIERLQNEYTEEVTTIQPNVRVPFSLVVPGVKGEEAWFSARIYSVNKV